MAAPILQVDYDRLAAVARQFGRNAEVVASLQDQVQRSAQALRAGGWQGRGSAAFFAEMDKEITPALQRLTSALRQAQDVSIQIGHLMRQAEEEAAEPFRGRDASGNGSTTTASGSSLSPAGEHNDPAILNMTETSGNLAEWLWDRVGQLAEKADTVKDGVTVTAAALLARGLKEGSQYQDEVIIAAPAIPKFLEALGINKGWLRNQAGLAKTLTHIKAENLAGHISRRAGSLGVLDGVIAVGKGVSAIADVWQARSDEYASYTASRRAAAMLVDASLELIPIVTEVTGGIVGTKLGVYIGGAFMGIEGSVVPGAGTALGVAIGALIGGAVGGIAGDLAGRITGNIAANYMADHWRAEIIDFIDRQAAQPVIEAINKVTQKDFLNFNLFALQS